MTKVVTFAEASALSLELVEQRGLWRLVIQVSVATLDVFVHSLLQLPRLLQGCVRARREILPLRLTHFLDKVEEFEPTVTHRQ